METVFFFFEALVTLILVFVVGLIGFVIIARLLGFGDSKLWCYESEGISEYCGEKKLEIEFNYWEKRGHEIELEVEGGLTEPITSPIVILVNGVEVVQFGAQDANKSGTRFKKFASFNEPNVGDTASIKLGEMEIYSGQLICDLKKDG